MHSSPNGKGLPRLSSFFGTAIAIACVSAAVSPYGGGVAGDTTATATTPTPTPTSPPAEASHGSEEASHHGEGGEGDGHHEGSHSHGTPTPPPPEGQGGGNHNDSDHDHGSHHGEGEAGHHESSHDEHHGEHGEGHIHDSNLPLVIQAEDAAVHHPFAVVNRTGPSHMPGSGRVVMEEAACVGTPVSSWELRDPAGAAAAAAAAAPGGGNASSPDRSAPLEVSFEVEEEELFKISARIHAPDTMSDTFWVMFDGNIGSLSMWTASAVGRWVTGQLSTTSLSDPNKQQRCFHFAKGHHTLSFFVREPGAAIDYFVFDHADDVLLDASQEGCSGGCDPSGGSLARLRVRGLCGPDTLHLLRITVGGEACSDIRYESGDVVTCVTPPFAGAEAVVHATQSTHAGFLSHGSHADHGDHDEQTATILYQIPKEAEDSALPIILGSSLGVFGLCLFGVVGFFVWHRRKHRVAFEAMFGSSVLAAEMAEAIATLDFATLEKLDRLENPDRSQRAMQDIKSVMTEFVKYIPQHVIKTIRGDTDADDGDEGDADSSAKLETSQAVPMPFPCDNSTGGSSPPPLGDSLHYNLGSTVVVANPNPHSIGQLSPTHQGSMATPQKSGSMTRTTVESGTGSSGVGSGGRTNPDGGKSVWRGIAQGIAQRGQRNVVVLTARPAKLHRQCDEAQASFISVAVPAVEATKGCVHRIAEDCIVATWGATGQSTASISMSRVLKAALSLSREGHHSGVYGATAKCGYTGTESMQVFHIFGDAVAESDGLSRVAQACRAPAVVQAGLLTTSMRASFVHAPFFPVVAAKGYGVTLSTAVVLRPSPVANKEWMYELADRQDDREVDRVLVEALTRGDLVKAVQSLSRSLPEHRAGVEGFAKWLEHALALVGGDPGVGEDLGPLRGAASRLVLQVTVGGALVSQAVPVISDFQHAALPMPESMMRGASF